MVATPAGAPAPDVTVRPAEGKTTGVVLVLPGGKAASRSPARRHHLSALRMVPFARELHRAVGRQGMAVWTLRYRYRGWNGTEASPVLDARWALEEIRRRHGEVPVVLVGHSMGGRTALRVADDPAVHAVVALAPWLPPDEPVAPVGDRRVLIMHGTADRWTDPHGSLTFARRARAISADLRRIEVHGVGHTMLRRAALWHGLTTYFVQESVAVKSTLASGANVPLHAARAEVRLLV